MKSVDPSVSGSPSSASTELEVGERLERLVDMGTTQAVDQARGGGRMTDAERSTELSVLEREAPVGSAHGAALGLRRGVVTRPGPTLELEVDGRSYRARRAKSCLVAPAEGDHVLCLVEGGSIYVLAVLEGTAGAPTRLETEGDLLVDAAGSIELSGRDRLTLRAAEAVVTVERLRVRAKTALAALEELGVSGRSLEAHIVDKVLVATEALESRATRVVQRARQVFRFVDELDQVRAGTVDIRAETVAAVRGEATIVAARVLAKVDAEQVKIG